MKMITLISKKIDKNEKYLLALAFFVGLLWCFTQKIGYSPDSTTYIILSQALAGNASWFESYVFMRTVGYPILMLVSGVPFLNSFKILILIQFVMAISMPLLFYRSLNLIVHASKFSFYCSVFLILSLLPFIYCKLIMTDHFFIFMMFFVSYRLILFYQSQEKKDLWFLGASLTVLTLIRPSANLFLMLTFFHSSLFIRKHIKTWLKGLCLFLSIMMILSASYSLNRISMPHIVKGTNLVQRLNQTLFYHLYLKGFYNSDEKISPDTCASQLKYIVAEYTKKNKLDEATYMPEFYYKELKNNPDQFVENVFSEPNAIYFRYIKSALESEFRDEKSNIPPNHSRKFSTFIFSLSCEMLKKHPKYLFSFIKTYLLGSGSSFAGQMLFYHTYIPLPLLTENKNIDNFYPRSGIQNYKLHEAIKNYVLAYPQNWQTIETNAKFKDNPENFLKNIVDNPNANNHWFMWNAINSMYSSPEAPNIFMAAAIENIMKNKEISLLMYINNILYFMLGSSSYYYHGSQKISMLSIEAPGGNDPFLSSHPRYKLMKSEIENGPIIKLPVNFYTNFLNLESIVWSTIKIVTSLFILCGFILVFKTKNINILSMLLLMWLFHIIISSVFGEPVSRYVFHIMPLSFILSFSVLFEILQFFRMSNLMFQSTKSSYVV